MKLGLIHRDEIRKISSLLEEELDFLISAISTTFLQEHDWEGRHTDIAVNSLKQRFDNLQNTTPSVDGIGTIVEDLAGVGDTVPVLGTWTPVIGGSGGTSGQTYSSRSGISVKIGKLVVCYFRATLSAKGTITTTVQIQGLPYTPRPDSITNMLGFAFLPVFNGLATNWIWLGGYVLPGSVVNITGMQAAGASIATLVTADIGNTADIGGVIIYAAE